MARSTEQRRLRVPESLAREGYVLREETTGDRTFLENLYVSTRWPELAATNWTDPEKLDFLQGQFALQSKHYRTFYAEAEFAILEYAGVPVGRIYLYRGCAGYRVVDISIAEAFRKRGVGTALLQAVIDEAGKTGNSTSIHVEKDNPAQQLYRRLGFRQAGETGPYWLMVRPCEFRASAGDVI